MHSVTSRFKLFHAQTACICDVFYCPISLGHVTNELELTRVIQSVSGWMDHLDATSLFLASCFTTVTAVLNFVPEGRGL